MTKKSDEPAFPIISGSMDFFGPDNVGLTKRDLVSALILSGLMTRVEDYPNKEMLVEDAIDHADILLSKLTTP